MHPEPQSVAGGIDLSCPADSSTPEGAITVPLSDLHASRPKAACVSGQRWLGVDCCGGSAWLKQHPEIVTISRDRCGLYAEGATLGAPQSQQVADRFHLLVNLSATMERVLEKNAVSN